MSLLTPGNDSVMGTDALASMITAKVAAWENRRDMEYRDRWMEYYRLWRGIWAPEDRDRISERSHAIMPALSQAVDSAVAEQEDATFGRERWFDVASEQSPDAMRELADMALTDLRSTQADVSRCFLLAAIYGTGIGKIVLSGDAVNGITLRLAPIEPLKFAIDPSAETIDEAEGVAHRFTLPAHIVYQRQREGIYANVDPGKRPESLAADDRKTGELALADTDAIEIIEYHGLVPRNMLPREERPEKEGKVKAEDDEPVEAIVTIANLQVVLKAVANPLTHRDRAFIAFQHNTVPHRFYGRGVMEAGYWPQKVLDSEIRARIDALAYSTHPMMAINAAAIPRSDKFTVRPGRNVFLNGAISDSIAPLNFPPPDPQTYTQSAEMQRMVEMATGQLQAASPIGVNARNNTASGMSMMLGASIRRTKRTMANIERDFLRPYIKKAIWRFQQFNDTYPAGAFDFKVYGTLGIMAREFEQIQLTQLLNSLPPGPQSLLIMRAVVDNSSLVQKEEMIQIVDHLLEQSLQPPPEPPPDLAGEARMLSAQTQAQKVQHGMQMDELSKQLDAFRLQLQEKDSEANHQRGIMAISVQQDEADSKEVEALTGGILDLAKAEAEALKQTLAEMKNSVVTQPASTSAPAQFEMPDLDDLRAQVEAMREQVERSNDLTGEDVAPIRIERDGNNLISGVNGRTVIRDENGLMQELR